MYGMLVSKNFTCFPVLNLIFFLIQRLFTVAIFTSWQFIWRHRSKTIQFQPYLGFPGGKLPAGSFPYANFVSFSLESFIKGKRKKGLYNTCGSEAGLIFSKFYLNEGAISQDDVSLAQGIFPVCLPGNPLAWSY